jgi:hypothetical protein
LRPTTWPETVSHVTPFHEQQSVSFFHVDVFEAGSWQEG